MTTAQADPIAAPRASEGSPALLPGLITVSTVIALISSLGAPLIPSIARADHTTLGAAQWSLTATLMVGAIASPVMGRLGDGRLRREVILAGLGAVFAGSVLAAASGQTLFVLLIGRGMQGLGMGLVPLTMAVARDHMSHERGRHAIATLSVTATAGVGLGYPITGLIAQLFDFHAAFWFGALITAMAFAFAVAVVPKGPARGGGRLDTPGTLLLGGGLVALLLAISEGNSWGWTSPTTLCLLAAALVLGFAWQAVELRAKLPLVDLRLLSSRAVGVADLGALTLGVALYLLLSIVSAFVQTPPSDGYGFGSSVLVAGLTLMPFSVMSVGVSRFLPLLARHTGARTILSTGSLTIGAGALLLAVSRSQLWEAFAAMALTGLGVGLTYAAIPGLILQAVPSSETGSAMGFYQVSRYIGFSLGSAVAAAVLRASTAPHATLPSNGGYGDAFYIGAGVCVLTALITLLAPSKRAYPVDDEPAPAPTL
jgi:MFS family permease